MSDAAKEEKSSTNTDGVTKIPATAPSRGGNEEKIHAAYGEGETSRRSTEEAAADRTSRYRNRKAERNSEKEGEVRADTPGAQSIGSSSTDGMTASTKKAKGLSQAEGHARTNRGNNDGGVSLSQARGHANEEDVETVLEGNTITTTISEDNDNNATTVPLAAEISDIHEENERLRRRLEERNRGEAGDIPVAQVMPKTSLNVNDDDEEVEDNEGCRPTKTNVACMVLCFAVILGATIGIVLSASKTEVVVDPVGSPEPSPPPTLSQIPTSAPSETPPWLFVAEKAFSKQVEERIENEELLLLLSQSRNKIIWRHCPNCTSVTHQNIYYKRLTDPPSQERDFNGEVPTDFLDLFLNNWYDEPKNKLNKDFELYSTYEDALAETNRWEYCNYDQKQIGFPRECAPGADKIAALQWTSFLGNDRYGAGVDHTFWVENDMPTVSPFPTTLPSRNPTAFPTKATATPSAFPTKATATPSASPTFVAPTIVITPAPTSGPTMWDAVPIPPAPTNKPSPYQTYFPVSVPVMLPPTNRPPTPQPTSSAATAPPTITPTSFPTFPGPSSVPVMPAPTSKPPTPRPTSSAPIASPTIAPTSVATDSGQVDFCPEGMIEFEFVIFTDFFGSETTWDLKGADGSIIVGGGPYADFQLVGVGRAIDDYGDIYCIPIETCYSLNINDDYGDGIFSPGGYRARLGDTVIADVVGGTKFKTRAIDMARTVRDSFGTPFTGQNCEEVEVDSGCYTLEGLSGEEFLGRIDQEFSYSVIIGETFTQKNMKTNSETLLGVLTIADEDVAIYEGEGNVTIHEGEDYCDGFLGFVELVESSEVDSVQTFFSHPMNCTLGVEIRVPVCAAA